MKRPVLSLFLILASLVWTAPALAHKVNVFAYAEGGTIFTESFFVDGTPCRECRITAYDSEENVVAEGITDGEGLYSFAVTGSKDVTIVIEASMGHRNEITMTTAEKGDENVTVRKTEASVALSPGDKTSVSAGEIEEVVGRILEEKLKPIRGSIFRLQQYMERPSLGQILGGIGWIVGLTGAYLWGASRRSRRGDTETR